MTPDSYRVPEGLSAAQKISVLIDAMPWIEEFRGAVVVVKYGGNALGFKEGLEFAPSKRFFCRWFITGLAIIESPRVPIIWSRHLLQFFVGKPYCLGLIVRF